MKKIQLHKTIVEYRAFIREQIVTQPEFYSNPFYTGLIDFIIDHRTPIFFHSSQEYEKAHFTQYFNLSLMRDGYENPYLSDLYYLHDFVHMAFYNPWNPRSHSFEEFCKIVIDNEFFASNETEMLTYYRLPSLRKKTLPQKIVYDVLIEKQKEIPDVQTLYDLRKGIIHSDFIEKFFLTSKEDKEMLGFLKKFKRNDALWCREWYDKFSVLPEKYSDKPLTLSYTEYGEKLMKYESKNDEQLYQNNILMNIQRAFLMLQLPDMPQTFEDCFEGIKVLENKIIMEDSAKYFHKIYSNPPEPENT